MKNLVVRFLRNESGATVLQYSLIAAFISFVIILSVRNLGDKLQYAFQGQPG
jgi:pilus assembly protein Flp/PilA